MTVDRRASALFLLFHSVCYSVSYTPVRRCSQVTISSSLVGFGIPLVDLAPPCRSAQVCWFASLQSNYDQNS